MEENTVIGADYQRGFNEGYLISQHMPDISEKLANALPDSERGSGFKDGRQQFVMEQKRERYPAWMRSDRMDNLSKDETDRDKDRDDPEHER